MHSRMREAARAKPRPLNFFLAAYWTFSPRLLSLTRAEPALKAL